MRADPLFNCQACVVDIDSRSEIVTAHKGVSVLPPTVTNHTEADRTFCVFRSRQCASKNCLSSVLG